MHHECKFILFAIFQMAGSAQDCKSLVVCNISRQQVIQADSMCTRIACHQNEAAGVQGRDRLKTWQTVNIGVQGIACNSGMLETGVQVSIVYNPTR